MEQHSRYRNRQHTPAPGLGSARMSGHDGQASGSSRVWLTRALEDELEWLAGEAPPNVARHARIVLGRAHGMSIPAIAAVVGVHPNTVRNCLRRFEAHGPHGLLHAGAGKPKNIAFSDAVRDEIARVAMHSPTSANETYAHWSLRRLRSHLLGRGVVQAISVEGLRQQLRGLPLPAGYWRRTGRPLTPLAPEVYRALESLVQGPRRDRSLRAQIVLASSRGLNEAEIAAGLRIGRSTVRRWLRRFRRTGILGLHTLPHRTVYAPQVRRAIARLATSDPRHHGLGGPVWSLETLQAALMRQRVVRTPISIDHLRKILAQAGVDLPRSRTAHDMHRSPAVG